MRVYIRLRETERAETPSIPDGGRRVVALETEQFDFCDHMIKVRWSVYGQPCIERLNPWSMSAMTVLYVLLVLSPGLIISSLRSERLSP